jgi:hypothetical protein
MLKVLFIFFFYLHLNYGAPESYTFNFTDMPSSIHLNFNGKPGKTVGQVEPIEPVVTVEPEAIKPVITVEPEPGQPVITVEPEPGINDCKCGIIPEENGMYRGGDLLLIFY